MKVNAIFRSVLFICLQIISAHAAFSQNHNTYQRYTPNNQESELTINQSEATAKVMELYTQQRQLSNKGLKGYSINIFTDSSDEFHDAKKGALNARAKFRNAFDNIPVETKYNAPFWRVYVGKFYTKSDARQFLNKMQYLFPNTAYIVPEHYEIPEFIE